MIRFGRFGEMKFNGEVSDYDWVERSLGIRVRFIYDVWLVLEDIEVNYINSFKLKMFFEIGKGVIYVFLGKKSKMFVRVGGC